MDCFARNAAGDPTLKSDHRKEILYDPLVVMKQGCNDPIVRLCYLRHRYDTIKPDKRETMYDHVVEQLEKHPYHPHFYVNAITFSGMHRLDQNTRPRDQKALAWQVEKNKLLLDLFKKIAADKEMGDSELRDSVFNIITCYKRISGDRLKTFTELTPMLKKHLSATHFETLRGKIYRTAAWDARGSGWADSVTQEGWKSFSQRIDESIKAFNAAWKANPSADLPINELMATLIGAGTNRPVMDSIFYRAMAINPDNTSACYVMTNYLQPKWHGSRTEMLQFGRQCLLTGNWEGKLPEELLRVHRLFRFFTVDGRRLETPDPTYYSRPGVWNDVHPVYEAVIKRRPKDESFHAKYASAALSARKWKIAHREMRAIGPVPDFFYFRYIRSGDQFRDLVRQVKKLADQEEANQKSN